MSQQLADVLVGTVVLASIYALVGIGIVILFRSTAVVNFAQGAFMVAGAYLFYWGLEDVGLSWPLALLLSMSAMAVFGALCYVTMFRRLVGFDPFILVIATLGLGVVIQTVVAVIWGSSVRIMPGVFSLAPIDLPGNLRITPSALFGVVAAVVLIAALDLSMLRTRVGVRMRAVADRTLLASFVGVNVHLVSASAWAISSVCAGVAGAAFALQHELNPLSINALGLVAFPAVLLGGMDSIRGALVGGLLMALIQNLVTTYIGGIWSDVSAYVVLLAILLVRPSGIFGSPTLARL
ncbi:MAG: hypothetical protein CL424_09045 [Acidimicrobiaceae bacterium]|nr:hypothetical protein [Acidimicrobiaceae bacterium]